MRNLTTLYEKPPDFVPSIVSHMYNTLLHNATIIIQFYVWFGLCRRNNLLDSLVCKRTRRLKSPSDENPCSL